MHLLPCPSCQASISVSPSQAGDETTCPKCQSSVVIPKLGQIRQLPLAEDGPSGGQTVAKGEMETSSGRRAGFVVLSLIGTASLLAAGFCGIRWSLIDVPSSTEQHIARYREEYAKLSAAELVREYEDMEKYGVELGRPYRYKTMEMTKKKWGQNASIAAGIGGLAILGAVVLVGSGGRNPS